MLIPAENVRDLAEIPDIVKDGMEIIPVSRMDQVIEHALVRKPEPIEWNFDDVVPAVATPVDTSVDDAAAGLPH